MAAGPYFESYRKNEEYDKDLQASLKTLGNALIANFYYYPNSRPDKVPNEESSIIISQMKDLYYKLLNTINKEYEELDKE
jgi:hypothetical protein